MQALKRAFLAGALVVVPLGAIVLLILGIVRRLEQAAEPLAGGYVHPLLAAIIMLPAAFLLVGLALRSTPGRRARRALEALLFEQIPGYRLVKAFTSDDMLIAGDRLRIRPALATIEDGLCPALVMEEFADGRLVVFVPGTPAPMSGALYVFTTEKVILLDVPLLPFLKAISSWGLGMRQIVESHEGIAAAPSGGEVRR